MTFSCPCNDKTRMTVYALGGLGTFLIVGALAWLLIQKAMPPGVDQARIELRRKNLAEVRATDKLALETYGWIDPAKGIVRLPIARALEMSLVMAQDPAASRSNLLGRLEKATAKLPEKPNVYE